MPPPALCPRKRKVTMEDRIREFSHAGHTLCWRKPRLHCTRFLQAFTRPLLRKWASSGPCPGLQRRNVAGPSASSLEEFDEGVCLANVTASIRSEAASGAGNAAFGDPPILASYASSFQGGKGSSRSSPQRGHTEVVCQVALGRA